MKIFIMVSLIIFLTINSYAKDDRIMQNLLNVLSKNEPNNYYKEKIKNFSYNYYFETKIEKQNFKLFAYNGGTHSGILHLVPEGKQYYYRIDMGPLHACITNEAVPFLKSNELMLVTSTGGSGTHHVYAVILTYKDDKIEIVSSFPLHGYICPASDISICVAYRPLNMHFLQDKIALTLQFEMTMNGGSFKGEKAYLESKQLLEEKYETADISISRTGVFHIKTTSKTLYKTVQTLLNQNKESFDLKKILLN